MAVVALTLNFTSQGLHAQTQLKLEPENPPGYVPSPPPGAVSDNGALSPQQQPGPQFDKAPKVTTPKQPVAQPDLPANTASASPSDAPFTAPTPTPNATPPPTPTPETTFQDPSDLTKAVNGASLNTNKNDPNSPAAGPSYPATPKQNQILDITKTPPEKKLYATVVTSEGSFKFKLFPQYAPKTVKNFTDLATGQKEFVEAATSRKSTRPFYNGQIIFKVVRDFVIQMGCPFGDGRGGPGYEILDEFTPYLHHDKAGMVSMANHGPNTAGSQFFVTLGPQPTFDDKYSIFGQIVSGMDVVNKISRVRTGPTSRPLKRIVIQKIEIEGTN